MFFVRAGRQWKQVFKTVSCRLNCLGLRQGAGGGGERGVVEPQERELKQLSNCDSLCWGGGGGIVFPVSKQSAHPFGLQTSVLSCVRNQLKKCFLHGSEKE